MRIVIDLDGVLCPLKQPHEGYADLPTLPGAPERLRELKAAGHVIIIQTARQMATCEGNIGKVVQRVGLVTLEWLARHGIEYDEIHFGKPNGHVYIDDRAIRFEGWDCLTPDVVDRMARDR